MPKNCRKDNPGPVRRHQVDVGVAKTLKNELCCLSKSYEKIMVDTSLANFSNRIQQKLGKLVLSHQTWKGCLKSMVEEPPIAIYSPWDHDGHKLSILNRIWRKLTKLVLTHQKRKDAGNQRKKKPHSEHSLMMSLVFWPFLTYLPTLSYPITSLFWSYLGPHYLP